jgi:hypothetical protein
MAELQKGVIVGLNLYLGGGGYASTDGYIKGVEAVVNYTINTYTISVSSNGNGSVTGGGSGLTKG